MIASAESVHDERLCCMCYSFVYGIHLMMSTSRYSYVIRILRIGCNHGTISWESNFHPIHCTTYIQMHANQRTFQRQFKRILLIVRID